MTDHRRPGSHSRVAQAAAAFTMAVLIPAFASAQEPAPGAPATFDVATIKVNASGSRQTQLSAPPGTGRIIVTNMMLPEVIQSAWGIQSYQVVNLPDWARTQRVDITAKAERPASIQQLQAMLQPLLVERYKLATHREAREMDALLLVTARTDRQLGPKITPSSGDCGDAVGTTNRLAIAGRTGGAEPATCGITPAGPGRIIARGLDMNGLAALLAPSQRRVVLDRTTLPGRFDIDLTYTPEPFSAASLAARNASPMPGVDPNGPSLAAALQEQLGLRLDAQRAPVDVLVIDRMEPLAPE